MKRVIRLIVIILLFSIGLLGQTPPPYAMLAQAPNGLWAYTTISSAGLLNTTGGAGPGLNYFQSGYVPPFAAYALNPQGVWVPMNLDASGNLKTTSSGGSGCALTGCTYTGEIITAAPTTGTAGFNLPHGTAPTSPVNGDFWTTTTGVFARINGTTVGPFAAGGSGTVGSCGTTNAFAIYTASTTTGCGNADFTYATHTLTGGASALVDFSAMVATAFKIPVVAGAAPTADGQMATNSTTHALNIGSNGSTLVEAIAATGATNTATTCSSHNWLSAISGVVAPTCSQPGAADIAVGTFQSGQTFVAPVLGAATATSLLASGIVDGEAPVTLTTGASCTLGTTSGCNATAYNSGYTFNQEATAGAAVTYTLPTPAAGKQYCVKNSYNGSAADTGVLTVAVATPGTHFIIRNGTKGTSTGTISSGGAAGDSVCLVGISSTLWEAYVQVGVWTLN